MAETILKNTKIYFAGYDLSGDMNAVTVSHTVDLLNKTVFGSSFQRRMGGLRDMTISGGGFYNASVGKNTRIIPDAVGSSGARTGSTANVVTIVPEGTGITNEAYFASDVAANYSMDGSIGGMLGFSFAVNGQADLTFGYLLRAGWGSTLAAQAVIKNLGAVSTQSANIKTACAVHTLASSGAAGASITLHIDRCTTTDFSSAATTALKITLTTANVGLSGYYSTKLGTTKGYSYRINTSQAGTSLKRLNFVAVVGHTKK